MGLAVRIQSSCDRDAGRMESPGRECWHPALEHILWMLFNLRAVADKKQDWFVRLTPEKDDLHARVTFRMREPIL